VSDQRDEGLELAQAGQGTVIGGDTGFLDGRKRVQAGGQEVTYNGGNRDAAHLAAGEYTAGYTGGNLAGRRQERTAARVGPSRPVTTRNPGIDRQGAAAQEPRANESTPTPPAAPDGLTESVSARGRRA